jgi:hypothetical protein
MSKQTYFERQDLELIDPRWEMLSSLGRHKMNENFENGYKMVTLNEKGAKLNCLTP